MDDVMDKSYHAWETYVYIEMVSGTSDRNAISYLVGDTKVNGRIILKWIKTYVMM
jgi:hypothetical protein